MSLNSHFPIPCPSCRQEAAELGEIGTPSAICVSNYFVINEIESTATSIASPSTNE